MHTLHHDLRLAVRMLTKSPLFTTIVVLTMAIAIGLNATVFSAVEALMLRPLPGATAPDRLVQVYRSALDIEWGTNSVPHYLDVREQSTDVFSDVAAWTFAPFSLSSGDQSRRLMGQVVSANFFSTLGAQPAMGRFFLPDEDIGRGAHPVVVLSDAGWHSILGGSPNAIGQSILLNGQRMEVIGVAAPGFRGAMPIIEPVAYVPLMQLELIQPAREGLLDRRGNNFMNVIARLRDDVTPTQAAARLDAVNAELAERFPEEYEHRGITIIRTEDAGIHPMVRSAQVDLSAVILSVVGILLLVACVNVSNLFLARARDRAREMAIRLALGATRAQLIRQLLTESLVFALLAGAVGVLVAFLGIAVANQIRLPMDVGFRPDLQLNTTVLVFTCAVSLLAGLLFGLAPALQATHPSLVPALKGEAPAGDGRSRVRRGLVVAQMALSIILLTSAGLFLSNLRTATTLDVGFTVANASTASLAPDLQGYDRARSEQFYATLLERLRATPGVQAAGLVTTLPLGLSNSDRGVEIPGYVPAEGEGMNIQYASVSPDYFAAMGTPMLAGREFSARDDSLSTRSLVVNQRFVDRFWPGQDAVGRTVQTSGELFTVVGVVPTGKYVSLGEDPRAAMFFAQAQEWSSSMQLVVRSDADPTLLLTTIRSEVQALDPQLPISDLQSLEAHLGTALLPARVAGGALGLFGLLGLLLAGVGIYGVMAYSVGQRTREIGIRLALGATTDRIVRLIMSQGLRQVLLGCVLGVAGAVGAYMLIRSVLYGAGSMTTATFVLAPVVLLTVATLALWLPARRASRLEPQIALRHD